MRSSQTAVVPTLGFLSLPPELRLVIYEMLFVQKGYIFLHQDARSSKVRVLDRDPPRQWLSLLLTCRQVHIEARVVVYGRNTFNMDTVTFGTRYAPDLSSMQAERIWYFLDGIGPTNAALLESIRVMFPRFSEGGEAAASTSVSTMAVLRRDDIKPAPIDGRLRHSEARRQYRVKRFRQLNAARLQNDSLFGLRILRAFCPRVSTLQMALRTQTARSLGPQTSSHTMEQPYMDHLQHVAAYLHDWPEMKNVIIYLVFVLRYPPLNKELLESFGWQMPLCVFKNPFYNRF